MAETLPPQGRTIRDAAARGGIPAPRGGASSPAPRGRASLREIGPDGVRLVVRPGDGAGPPRVLAAECVFEGDNVALAALVGRRFDRVWPLFAPSVPLAPLLPDLDADASFTRLWSLGVEGALRLDATNKAGLWHLCLVRLPTIETQTYTDAFEHPFVTAMGEGDDFEPFPSDRVRWWAHRRRLAANETSETVLRQNDPIAWVYERAEPIPGTNAIIGTRVALDRIAVVLRPLLAFAGGGGVVCLPDGTALVDAGAAGLAPRLGKPGKARLRELFEDLLDDALAGHEAVLPTGEGPLKVLVERLPLGLIGVRPINAPPDAASGGRDAVWPPPLLDAVQDVMLAVGPDGAVRFAAGATRAVLGLAPAGLVGLRLDTLVADADDESADLVSRLADAAASGLGLLVRGRRGGTTLLETAVKAASLDGLALRVLTLRDVTVRRQTEEAMAGLLYRDTLTDLPNRLLFYDRLEQALERARRQDGHVAVMLIDLDRFKVINDSLGMRRGDEVIKHVAGRLAPALRPSDTLGRLSGDEFMVLLPALGGPDAAAKTAQDLVEAMQPPLRTGGHELAVQASIGIALFPHDGDDPDTLVKNAAVALSRVKEQGRGHYQFFTTDMNAAAFERLMLETRLRRALVEDELVVHYQPQVAAEGARIVGVEALVRWRHPDLGMIPPGEFIPLAEETGLIVPIGARVLQHACEDAARWRREGFLDLRLAVNLSGRQFQDKGLVDAVRAILAETGFPPERLELELTESVIMRDVAEATERLRELSRLGISLAVDDFGTGYSSLAYLKRFPIRSLKIDRSFVGDIDRDANSAAIASAIVALAGRLGLKVVAEGVETKEQLDLLRSYGCDELQGWLFGRPIPVADLLAKLVAAREGVEE